MFVLAISLVGFPNHHDFRAVAWRFCLGGRGVQILSTILIVGKTAGLNTKSVNVLAGVGGTENNVAIDKIA